MRDKTCFNFRDILIVVICGLPGGNILYHTCCLPEGHPIRQVPISNERYPLRHMFLTWETSFSLPGGYTLYQTCCFERHPNRHLPIPNERHPYRQVITWRLPVKHPIRDITRVTSSQRSIYLRDSLLSLQLPRSCMCKTSPRKPCA